MLCAIKLAVGAWVLSRGFTHVSDDDYARTVIAQQFAHAPRLDPSGTSWLPLPFWVEGSAMWIAGRSLGVARVVAVALGAASVVAPYVAMRSVSVSRAAAAIAVATAMVLPWNAWLGVATVPEGWAGALIAAAAIAMGSARARPWAATALCIASLSRYEAWPACAALAAVSSWRAVRGGHRGREGAWALVAVAGPIAWLAWNAHAHGSAVHFVARVTAFRHAVGAADIPLRDKLLDYPRALALDTPEAAALGIVGTVGLVASDPLRARWRWAVAISGVILAFLIWGDVQDGAPTHHPARALAALWWILVGMGVDAAFVFVQGWTASWRMASAAVAAMAWCASLPPRWDASPGRGESERRDVQVARGLDLRARGVAAVSITPCSFEHFALIAAWGAPENAEVEKRTGEPPTSDCPRVVER
ncbi:MAG TPA: hypothetical protein VN894_12780 [Polyangiaceae bacterium]|nr:hypothetical protein [Polyangiaceae bacterium]